MAEKPRDIEAIYSAALKKGSGQERSAYLDEVCGDDHALRARIEALLNASEEVGDFLEPPILDPDVTLNDSPMTEAPGTVIGPYKLLEKIGEGGMAVVYMAEQHKPFHRRVALKIIKLGMDTKQVISRFEVERQALAMMDHPNIAKVFDAGATETGRPYFVMELVRGLTITEYCDKSKLNTQERLELLVPVCNAVQHAHQKGIIHRDIKPSNIMVTLHDGKPVPKIIDFGIAKATNQRLTERTVFTRYAEMIGTPEYMSPEQAEMSGLDIDTRTDIYSLGVVLYELLTGVLPFDPDTLRSAAMGEIQRIIREEEPPRPSTRLSALGERAQEIAASRCTNAATLAQRLRRELEWIPLKAMRKERARRYRSASELADDIENYLKGAPLIAGPESAIYKLHKSIRRNRALVTAIAVVGLVLVIGTVVSVVFAMRANRARAEAAAVAGFLQQDIFGGLDPWRDGGRQVVIDELLEAATQNIDNKFKDQPLVEASVRKTVGVTYQRLGKLKEAEFYLQRALEIYRQQRGASDPSTLEVSRELGILYFFWFRFREAKEILIDVLDVSRRVLGEQHPETLASMTLLALVSMNLGHEDEAGAMLAEALDTTKRVLGEDHDDTVINMICLGAWHAQQGRMDEAESIITEALSTGGALSGQAPHKLYFTAALAWVYKEQGKYDEAEKLAGQVLQTARESLGEGHRSTVYAMYTLATIYEAQQRYNEAESVLVRAVEVREQEEPTQPDWMDTRLGLAEFYMKRGRYEEAEPHVLRALQQNRRIWGDEHFWSIVSEWNLGMLYSHLGHYEEAEEHFLHVLEIGCRELGDLGHEHGLIAACESELELLYAIQGHYKKIEALFLDRLQRLQQAYGEDHPALARYLNHLAWLHATHFSPELRNDAKAIGEATRACELTNWKNASYLDTLAAAYAGVSDFTSAVKWQKEAVNIAASSLSPTTKTEFEARLRLYKSGKPVYESVLRMKARRARNQSQYAKAERVCLKALETCTQFLGNEHPETLACKTDLIAIYEAWGKPQKAEEWRAKLPHKEGTEPQ